MLSTSYNVLTPKAHTCGIRIHRARSNAATRAIFSVPAFAAALVSAPDGVVHKSSPSVETRPAFPFPPLASSQTLPRRSYSSQALGSSTFPCSLTLLCRMSGNLSSSAAVEAAAAAELYLELHRVLDVIKTFFACVLVYASSPGHGPSVCILNTSPLARLSNIIQLCRERAHPT